MRRGESVIKLILSRGVEHGPTPTAWVTAANAPDFASVRRDGVSLVTLDRGFAVTTPARAPWLLLGAKTLSYAVNMAAIREAKRRGADDALFVTSDGFILEAPTASIIFRTGAHSSRPRRKGNPRRNDTGQSLRIPRSRRIRDELRATPGGLPHPRRGRLARVQRPPRGPVRAIDGRDLAIDEELTARMNEYLLLPRD